MRLSGHVNVGRPVDRAACRVGGWGWAALVLSIWLLCHPYRGIWHDAVIYLVLALNERMPQAYARDVWFAFGSQGSLSLFDEAYAQLLRWAWPAAAAKGVALAGGLIWIAGCLALAVRLLGWRGGAAAVGLVTILNPPYDLGPSLLLLNESFATARPYAMGLTLAGMAAWIGRRYVSAGLLSGAALLLHPLMAIGGMASLVVLSLGDRKVLGLLSLAMAGLIMGAAWGWSPLAPMDPLWESLVRHTSRIVFPVDASSVALDRIVWPLAVLLLAGRVASLNHRRLYHAVAVVAAWCLLVAVVVGLHAPAVLLAQAQLWRVSWLATVVAALAAVDLIAAQQPGQRFITGLGLGLSYVAIGSGFGSAMVLAAYVVCCIPSATRLTFSLWQTHCSKRARVLIMAILLVSTAGLASLQFDYEVTVPMVGPLPEHQWEVPAVLAYRLLPALLFWGIWSLASRGRLVMTPIVLALALMLWDQRTTAIRLMEAGYLRASDAWLQQLAIQRGDVVYWPGNSLGPWFVLGTAGYAQNVQAIGIVFSRAHAVTLYERMKRVRDLNDEDNLFDWMGSHEFDLHSSFYRPVVLSSDAIRTLCQDPQLDHVVQGQPAQSLPPHADALRSSSGGQMYAYHCSWLRR